MSLSNKDDIQVSVCVVTYNQENYIAECLESLVTQQTSFKFEIIVGEDCSTDNTRKIVQQYVEQYPDLVIPLFYENNVGVVENVKRVYKAAKGKYIAHMDGDDMALPNKLQRQFDILESNPDCVICAHNMVLFNKHGNFVGNDHIFHIEKKYSLFDLYIIHTLFRHSSKMFINNIDNYIDSVNGNMLDIELHAIQAEYGNIYLISDTLGGYRENVGITFKGEFLNQIIIEQVIKLYKSVDQSKFTVSQNKKIQKKFSTLLLSYAYLCAKTIQDEKMFVGFVRESLQVYKITFYQIVFILAIISPKLFFRILSLKKLLGYRKLV